MERPEKAEAKAMADPPYEERTASILADSRQARRRVPASMPTGTRRPLGDDSRRLAPGFRDALTPWLRPGTPTIRLWLGTFKRP